ncbi:hypothetical protein COU37_00470 [Candidatus Micrarchaeota archaeon CG10_big_fil_rev_8_21_14_0_10_45_29]|nr:MAG: hypothetical protein COU37_00470 [Candidatus Micrarchaeota archaeon CG10_big_fil_rev_8_21_14_0_10_45_29]
MLTAVSAFMPAQKNKQDAQKGILTEAQSASKTGGKLSQIIPVRTLPQKASKKKYDIENILPSSEATLGECEDAIKKIAQSRNLSFLILLDTSGSFYKFLGKISKAARSFSGLSQESRNIEGELELFPKDKDNADLDDNISAIEEACDPSLKFQNYVFVTDGGNLNIRPGWIYEQAQILNKQGKAVHFLYAEENKYAKRSSNLWAVIYLCYLTGGSAAPLNGATNNDIAKMITQDGKAQYESAADFAAKNGLAEGNLLQIATLIDSGELELLYREGLLHEMRDLLFGSYINLVRPEYVEFLFEKQFLRSTDRWYLGELLYNISNAGNSGVVKVFARNGANIEWEDGRGDSALNKKAAEGNLGMAKTLVKCGANIHHKNMHGDDALHIAAINGNLEVLKFFLDTKKADINAKDNNGNTILHIAAKADNLELAKIAHERGAGINILNEFSATPLDWCKRGGQVEAYLRSIGAKKNLPY